MATAATQVPTGAVCQHMMTSLRRQLQTRPEQQGLGLPANKQKAGSEEDGCSCRPADAGGDTFDVLVKRAGKSSTHSAVRGRVEDSGEGLYRASYVANFAGTYEVQVTAAGPLHCLHGWRGSQNLLMCLQAS